jgi:hypothetical protein
VSDWDDNIKAFATETDCSCTGYEGLVPVPPVASDCPHEVLPKLDPHRCIHCKKILTEEERHERAR